MTLVERLNKMGGIGYDAAAEIERLETENKQLGDHWDDIAHERNDLKAEARRLVARIMELERDNEHLRAEIEVLQRIRHRETVTS